MKKENMVRLNHIKPPFLEGDAGTAVVDLSRYGLEGQEEEIWVEEAEVGVALVSSIPFCIDGLALFDKIRPGLTKGSFDILDRSGRGVFRALVDQRAGESERQDSAALLSEFFISVELAHEWNGLGYVSVDVPSAAVVAEVKANVQMINNVIWGWGVECTNP
ncbi:DUF4265 domain-containing protein, partial [Nocardiopsis sp. CC223A]|uniref:DUF4265 domain-containing protein n=1 Tax=Nocardiopsis sp. CC223A TaxID=3044051 RepID=UPI0027959878